MAYYDDDVFNPGDPGNPGGGGGYTPAPQSDPFADQLNALYQQYYGRPASSAELDVHRGNPGGLAAVEALLKASQQPTLGNTIEGPKPPIEGPHEPRTNLTDPYSGTFTPPAPVNLGGPLPGLPATPEYTPPGYTPPPAFAFRDFAPPDAETVKSRPGYEFRRKEGERSILNDRAHSGLLNTGSTLKDLVNYGEDYATNEYGNEWNRAATEYGMDRGNAVDTYNTNYRTQYQDPYQISRQGALDAFAPKMVGYSTQAAAGQRQNELDWSHAFDLSNFDWQKFKDWRDSTFNMNYSYATA